jgi:hypothetical protein
VVACFTIGNHHILQGGYWFRGCLPNTSSSAFFTIGNHHTLVIIPHHTKHPMWLLASQLITIT